MEESREKELVLATPVFRYDKLPTAQIPVIVNALRFSHLPKESQVNILWLSRACAILWGYVGRLRLRV